MWQISLGIAGTAKNTGKTTTTVAVMQELRLRGIPVSLTSIGYDGENLDNLTGLPKPKLPVEPGDVIATAENCLKVSTASLKILEETQIGTPLGRIMIVEVKKAGLAVTAGPNKSRDVKIVSDLLRQRRPGVILFDGALNRIAPMAETDGFILATGAARTPNIVQLARETELIGKICGLPKTPRAGDLLALKLEQVTLLSPELTPLKTCLSSSLISEADVADLFSGSPPDASYLYIPGVMDVKALDALRSIYRDKCRHLMLVFSDPIKILLAGEPDLIYDRIAALDESGVITTALKRVPLLAVTVNPFYPEYRAEMNSYQPAFVDPVRLEIAVKSQVKLPVYNVARQGAARLVDTILLASHRWESPATVIF